MEDYEYNDYPRKGLTVPWPETVVRFGSAMIRLDYTMSLQFGATGMQQNHYMYFIKVLYVSGQEQVLTGSKADLFHLLEQLGQRRYYDKVTIVSLIDFVNDLDVTKAEADMIEMLKQMEDEAPAEPAPKKRG